MKRLIFVILFMSIILTACSNTAQVNDKQVTSSSEKSITTPVQTTVVNVENKDIQTDDSSWRKPVAEKMLSEFNDFYEKMQAGENVVYNKIMAADRATGLLCVYKDCISEENLKAIKAKKEKINENIGMPIISFGYTSSGLHIVALTDMHTNGSFRYRTVCNILRGFKPESDLLLDMWENHNYYVSDIFIEDLSTTRDTFNINIDFLQYGDPEFKPQQELNNISTGAKEAIKKYNRNIESKDGTYNNKSWRLITSESRYEFLRVHTDGEIIDLVSEASDRQSYDN